MHTALEPEPHHRVLHHKMRDSYTPNCLTALSVIQGVALADLAVVVGAGYEQFTLVQWLLVVLNFAILIIMWDSYIVYAAEYPVGMGSRYSGCRHSFLRSVPWN
jgi:hypothetical protein